MSFNFIKKTENQLKANYYKRNANGLNGLEGFNDFLEWYNKYEKKMSLLRGF
jgi:hypothetical protein